MMQHQRDRLCDIDWRATPDSNDAISLVLARSLDASCNLRFDWVSPHVMKHSGLDVRYQAKQLSKPREFGDSVVGNYQGTQQASFRKYIW